jgi:hypothetical protein
MTSSMVKTLKIRKSAAKPFVLYNYKEGAVQRLNVNRDFTYIKSLRYSLGPTER